MKKILITGGAGYIGSVTIERMVAQGLEPVALDNLVGGHREAVLPGVPLIEADLTDREAVRQAFSKFEFEGVIHLAALALVEESVREPAKYYRQNVGGMLNLLDSMLEFGVKRMVFSSSCSVYGIPAKVPIPEECPLAPVNPYGATKLAGERMLADYHGAYGLDSVSLRYFNVAGATERFGEDHRCETHLVPRVLQAALAKRPQVEIYGADYPTSDRTCIRDYIHVSDLAEAHILALQASPGRQAVYNLGNSRGYSVREVIACAEKVTGKRIPCVEHPRRPGDPPLLVAACEKATRELGWHPQHGQLGEIIESAWGWHTRHPHGYTR